ncbi:hypothetical protein V2J09_006560 [Rumex salicifolius]
MPFKKENKRNESVLSSPDTFFITFSDLVITLPIPSLFTKPSPSIPKSSVLAFHDSGVLLNRRSGIPQFPFILSSLRFVAEAFDRFMKPRRLRLLTQETTQSRLGVGCIVDV